MIWQRQRSSKAIMDPRLDGVFIKILEEVWRDRREMFSLMTGKQAINGRCPVAS
jgi:hypothetical protein